MSDVVGFNHAQSTYENKMPPPARCLYGFYIGDKVWVSKKNSSDYGFEGEVLGFDEGVIKVEVHGDDMKWIDWLPLGDLRKI